MSPLTRTLALVVAFIQQSDIISVQSLSFERGDCSELALINKLLPGLLFWRRVWLVTGEDRGSRHVGYD